MKKNFWKTPWEKEKKDLLILVIFLAIFLLGVSLVSKSIQKDFRDYRLCVDDCLLEEFFCIDGGYETSYNIQGEMNGIAISFVNVLNCQTNLDECVDDCKYD